MVRASLPLVAGLLCYHGLVLWCVGLQLCHWSLRSARAWVLGGCPRSRSSARSRGTPAARGAASAAPLASSGSATRRRRARAGPFGVQRAGQLLCGRGFCRVRLRRARPCFGARHMSLDRLRTVRIRAVVGQDDCFVLCSGSVSTACCTAGSGGIPTLSAARSHQSHLNSELLRTTSRGELYWQSTAAATPATPPPIGKMQRRVCGRGYSVVPKSAPNLALKSAPNWAPN